MTQLQSGTSAVVFVASEVNRYSMNALVGAIEQDERLREVALVFAHPRTCLEVIRARLAQDNRIVVALSFMTSALIVTDHLLAEAIY